MPKPFYERLRNYYSDVCKVLSGAADAARIFPNTSDIGASREKIYASFLEQHAPSKCNVFLGGFLFHEDGSESRQLDIIITTDTTPRFDFHNNDGSGKSFSPVEGTIGVVSVKSTLNQAELFDALANIASIPPATPLAGRINPLLNIQGYEDWPYKVVYASDGISATTLCQHIEQFYKINPTIPPNRRPNLIHVAGKYVIARGSSNVSIYDRATGQKKLFGETEFIAVETDSDIQGLVWVINALQERALASTQIMFSYGWLINNVNGLPR